MQRLLPLLLFMPVLLSIAGAAWAQEATPTVPPTETPSQGTGTPSTTGTPEPLLRAPLPGQALQGSVAVIGNTAIHGFVSAELAFSYAGHPEDTWFLIAETDQPVSDGTLAQWDTNAITDGNYDLRLRVRRDDGSIQEQVIPGLRVRNYTPAETNTPTPVTPTATVVPGKTPVPTQTDTPPPKPTPTTLPTNPAEVTSGDAATSLGKGALAILGLFALMGVYGLVRRIGNRE